MPFDVRTAARCGAKTRAGCACRQPAMANGRCRLHGGKSTGPRTPEGRERCRRARLRQGLRSREFVATRKEGMGHRRRLNALCVQATAMIALQRGRPLPRAFTRWLAKERRPPCILAPYVDGERPRFPDPFAAYRSAPPEPDRPVSGRLDLAARIRHHRRSELAETTNTGTTGHG